MKRISLNGVWQLRWFDGQRGDQPQRLFKPDADTSRSFAAEVPGGVHDTLIKHRLLAEPALGLNVLAARWVENVYWIYRRSFRVAALQPGERGWLRFQSLDLAAVVYINGHEVARHANSFYPLVVEVTAHLRRGENILVVQVESGLFHTMNLSAGGLGVQCDSELTKRPWLRKIQSSFGWDWAPHLLNVGIPGDVSLEIAREVRVDQWSVLSSLDPELSAGSVTVRAWVETWGAETSLRLSARVLGLEAHGESVVALPPGFHRLEVVVKVRNPPLWWPAGHGPQNLFEVQASVSVGRRTISTTEQSVGFRHVRVNQDRHPQQGHWYIVEINRRPVFLKGGNFVPNDLFPHRFRRRRYEQLIARAREANFNCLRVWGGGTYETDDFYELCDRRGIVVWQEFVYACAKYPLQDAAWLADVKREATWNVRRLNCHPSLTVWCGNNEMEQGNWDWGYEKGVAHPDYALFHLTLPVLVKAEDGTRHYQPSSPWSPEHIHPCNNFSGDQHPWSLGFGDTDFRKYRSMECRFPNEGGFLGPTALPTVLACLPAGQRHIGSFAWETHDNSVCYWLRHEPYPADRMLKEWLGRTVADMSIEDYVYCAGALHGEALNEYIRNFRRRMFHCASAIPWMYNDCWPAVRSWTVVDYYFRRTPAFHPVRRACQPVTVVVVREGKAVRVFGVNEGAARSAQLDYGLFSLQGDYPLRRKKEVQLPANASTLLVDFPAAGWDSLGQRSHAAFARLTTLNGEELARDRLILPLFKDLAWTKARVRIERRRGSVVLSSQTFAWRVCLDLDGELPFPDNFLDVFPGIPVELPWSPKLPAPRILRVGNDLFSPATKRKSSRATRRGSIHFPRAVS